MPGLSTARKLTIARALRPLVGAVAAARGANRRELVCTRRGVRWCLDLDEGIQLALYLGVFERSTSAALARLARSNALVFDIGANIGAQALPLAARLGGNGRVIAVEPADKAVTRFRQNLALNPQLASRVTLVHRALGAPGAVPAQTYYASWPLTRTPGSHPVHQGAPERSTAQTGTLDQLVEELGTPRVDLIKLDVDGHELPILHGATSMLARDRPTILFELCPYLLEERGESPAALTRLLAGQGYKLYDERTFEPCPQRDEDLLRTIPAGGSANLIAALRPPLINTS